VGFVLTKVDSWRFLMPKIVGSPAPGLDHISGPTIKTIYGNSTEILPRWPDGSFEVLCSDPPYGLPTLWNGTAGFHIGDSNMNETVALSEWIVAEAARIVTETGHLYLTAAVSIYPHLVLAAQKAGWKVRPWVWIRPNPRPINQKFAWRNNVEFVLYGYRRLEKNFHGGADCYVKTDDVTEDNYFESAPPLGKHRCHPNQKPTALFERWLRQTPGRVLDPFCGSGPALLAAQRLGLDAIGIDNGSRESDGKAWVEVANERLATDHIEHWV
jgi:DNA modification methylase